MSVSDPTRESTRGSPDATAGVASTTTSPTVPTWLPWVAVGAAVVGIALRFAASTPLWLDEALSVNISALPLGDIPEALRHDGHPPLYYVLLHGWIEVVGEGDTAVRALSGVLSVVSLPLAWLVGRRRGDARLGWLLVLVVSLSPFALRYATETRMYSLVVLLTLLGYLAVGRALDRPTAPRLVAVAAVSGALLLTHYWSFYLLAAVGALLLHAWWRAAGAARSALGRVIVAVAVGGLAFLPWLPSFLTQAGSTGTPWADPSRPTSVVSSTLSDLGGGRELAEALLYAVLAGALVVVGLCGRTSGRWTIELDVRTRPEYRLEGLLVVLTLTIGVVAAYAASGAYAGRYAAVFFIPLALLLAAGLHRIAAPSALAVVLVALIGLSLAGAGEVLLTDRTQAQEWADAVNAEAGPDDLVVYCPDQLGPAGSRLIDVPLERQLRYPDLGDPRFVDWADYAERNAASDPRAVADEVLERAGDGTVWLVVSRDYKTFEGKCDGLERRLARQRSSRTAVAEDGSTFFEHAAVIAFPAR